MLKQVGNAVPALLAYQLAKNIVEKTGCKRSIDLFCGAGGMTIGFKAAGIKSVLSNDIEESACTTLKINNPEIEVLCGDITKSEIKDKIVETALEKKLISFAADHLVKDFPWQDYVLRKIQEINYLKNLLM